MEGGRWEIKGAAHYRREIDRKTANERSRKHTHTRTHTQTGTAKDWLPKSWNVTIEPCSRERRASNTYYSAKYFAISTSIERLEVGLLRNNSDQKEIKK
jgi:hypothetical protein